MFNNAILTLLVSGAVTFSVTDAYDSVRGAAMNIQKVYTLAGKVSTNYNDVAAQDAMIASAEGLKGMAHMVESNGFTMVIR